MKAGREQEGSSQVGEEESGCGLELVGGWWEDGIRGGVRIYEER